MTDIEMATTEELVKELQRRHAATVIIVAHKAMSGDGPGPTLAQWSSGSFPQIIGLLETVKAVYMARYLGGVFGIGPEKL